MSKYKIEKNIDIPVKLVGRASDLGFVELPQKMDFGDSVYLDNRYKAYNLKKNLIRSGFNGVLRKEGTGYRVWKTRLDENKKQKDKSE